MDEKQSLSHADAQLPYNYNFDKENSGQSLSINWRAPAQGDTGYASYNATYLEVTREVLLQLGI